MNELIKLHLRNNGKSRTIIAIGHAEEASEMGRRGAARFKQMVRRRLRRVTNHLTNQLIPSLYEEDLEDKEALEEEAQAQELYEAMEYGLA